MSGKKWKTFWVCKGDHYGSKLRAFLDLTSATEYYKKSGQKVDPLHVIEKAALEEKDAQILRLVEALEKAKMLNGCQAMTCLPMNVREQDGSISQHRPKSIAGEVNDILTEALAKAKEMGK